jgi:hypothetical protein
VSSTLKYIRHTERERERNNVFVLRAVKRRRRRRRRRRRVAFIRSAIKSHDGCFRLLFH